MTTSESCADAPHDIEDLVDGLLGAAAEAEMLEHLERCPACREAREHEERLREHLAAPAGLVDGVMTAVRGERRRGRLLRVALFRVAAAAAVVLVAAIGLLLLERPVPEPETPRGPRGRSDETTVARAPDATSERARDLARRARLFLAAAEQAPPETLAAELAVSGLADALDDADLRGLAPADRDAVRRVALLGEAWRNDAPIAREEIAVLTEGLR